MSKGTQYKVVHTSQGNLTLARGDTAYEFHCGRCDQDKKAKLVAKWDKLDGTIVQICNGCYGNILSREGSQ
jgi:hypothetical protein